MKPKVFKYFLASCLALILHYASAQVEPPQPPDPNLKELDLNLSEKLKDLDIKLKELKELKLDKLDQVMANVDIKLQNTFKKFENDFEKSFNDLQIQQETGELRNTVEKTKTVNKLYKVDANDKLAIDNQYGNVTVNTWAKNEIKVDVIIKAYGVDQEEAVSLLNGVNIAESRQTNLISLTTSIARNKGNWWGIRRKDGKEERRGVQVNYQIYMPAANPLDVTNKYGSTEIADFRGVLNINSSYGSFSGQTLTNPASRIRVRYGSASIKDLKAGNIDVQYGSLKVDKAERLNADIAYSSAKIGTLSGIGDVHLKYSGGFRIDEVSNKVKDLNINSAYSSVSLGFEPSASFDFDVTVNYGGFKYDNNRVNIVSTTPDENAKGFNPSKNYKGHLGKSSNSKIIIKSNYGSVNFQ